MRDEIGLVIIAVGVLFDLFGCIGIVRLPDVFNRIQAGTKCVTLGVCLILIGAFVIGDTTAMRLKSLLCVVFIVTTSPTAAHALACAARRCGIRMWEKSVVDQFERSA